MLPSSLSLAQIALDERENTPATSITYAMAPCSLGLVLIAATAKGLCRIDLDDHPEALLARLRQNFPNASTQEEGEGIATLIEGVLACIEQPCHIPTLLPLDIQGTAFQKRVWQALQDIPPGQTITYSQLAQKIGQPSAFRAVATACAANSLAILIPCHRVIAKDGGLQGYRWGIERKQALLEREANRQNPRL